MKLKKTAYVYKLMSKYVKHPEALMAKFPFISMYKGEDETMLAMPFRLPKESLLVTGLVKQIEFLYERGTSKDREEWEKEGYEFTEVLNPDQSTHFTLNMNDKIWNEVSEAQFCISLSELDKGFVFVNGPNKVAYYNVGIYKDCGLEELINALLKAKCIYKKKVRYGSNA